MIDPKKYAGLYAGKPPGFSGIDLILILREDRGLIYVVHSAKHEFYVTNTGTHSAVGDVLTADLTHGVREARLYIGKKVVIEDATYGDTEMFLLPCKEFWNADVKWTEGEKVPDAVLEPLCRIMGEEPPRVLTPEEKKKTEEEKERKKEEEKREAAGRHPLRRFVGRVPPYLPVCPRGGGKKRGERKRPVRNEPEKRERPERPEDPTGYAVIGIKRPEDDEHIDKIRNSVADIMATDAGAYEDAQEDADAIEDERFVYVLGQRQSFYIEGITVTPHGFIGLTERGVVRMLPMFFYAGANENVPWKNILTDITEYGDIVNLIFSDAGNVIAPALAEVLPNTKHYGAVWNLPSDAPYRKEAEKLNMEFENMFKKYWRFREVKDFDEAERFAEEYLAAFEEHFKEFMKQFAPAVQPAPQQAPPKVAPVQPAPPAPVQPKPAQAAPADAPQQTPKVPGEKNDVADAPVCCFVFEKYDAEGRIVAIFNQVADGKMIRSVLVTFPEKINELNRQVVIKKAAPEYENAIKKAASAIGKIGYILFRGCTMNWFEFNKSILPDTVWCGSVADIPNTVQARQANLSRFGEIESQLTGGISSIQVIEERLKKLGIDRIEVK